MVGKGEIEAAITALENSIGSLDRWVLGFGALVAVGVTGETVLGIRHWLWDRQLRNLRRTESQLHEEELERLRNDTENARSRAANAELETEKLREKMRPRRLSTGQQKTISTKLRMVRATVAVLLTAQDSEKVDFAKDIIAALQGAEWTATLSVIGGVSVRGVVVETGEGVTQEQAFPAATLVDALLSEYADTFPTLAPRTPPLTSLGDTHILETPIWLVIGDKY